MFNSSGKRRSGWKISLIKYVDTDPVCCPGSFYNDHNLLNQSTASFYVLDVFRVSLNTVHYN